MGLRIEMKVKVRNRVNNQAAAVRKESSDIVDDIMSSVVDKVRLSMKEPKGGHTYVRHHVTHRASAPGQAPGIEPFPAWPTGGQLFASISKNRTGEFSGEVFTRNDYARYLEVGTSKMRPRPFMRPAARKTRTEYNLLAPEKFAVRIAKAGI